jgi:hypothetical protein
MIFTTFDIETCTGPTKWWDLVLDAGLAAGSEEWVREHAGDHALCSYDGIITCWSAATWHVSADHPLTMTQSDSAVIYAGPVPAPEHENLVPDEVELLARLARYVGGDVFPIVAHNGNSFDFDFVRARAVAAGMPRLAAKFWQEKPWSGRLVDTADPSWSPRGLVKGRRSMPTLDRLATLCGVKRPPQVSGKETPAEWMLGRWESVLHHCRDDVMTLGIVTAKLLEARNWVV